MQLPLDIQWNAAATLERYIAGANADAVRLVEDLVAGTLEAPAIHLHGPAGVGKSHLLQGACRRLTGEGRMAVYLPLHQLSGYGVAVLEGWESAALVALDDLDELEARPDWQEGVFHLFNRTVDAGGRLLLAARRPPLELPVALEDLRSRVSWGPVVGLHPADEATCRAILRQRAGVRGLDLPDATVDYLLRRVPRDLPQLLELFEALDRASLAAGRRLTVPFVRQTLRALHWPGVDTQPPR